MKRLLLTFFCLYIMLLTVKGQVVYQDNLVKITGYLSKDDSCLFFQIENISDSVLILNEKNINFVKVRANEWAADLSLASSGISLLQPNKSYHEKLGIDESDTNNPCKFIFEPK